MLDSRYRMPDNRCRMLDFGINQFKIIIMIAFAFYLLKVIICSGVLFGYYWCFLRNKVFHHYNRFYLLVTVVLSLSLPLLKYDVWHKASEPPTNMIKMLQVVNSGDAYVDEVIVYSHYNTISKEQVFQIFYLAVSAILLFLFAQVLFRIWRLVKNNPGKAIEDIQFIRTNAKGTPFSFLQYIFWNDAIDLDTKTGRQIFSHEVSHVREKHSYDKLFINILLVIFWSNPVFWFIRKELNMIHEFIADKKAVEDGNVADFAAMILQATYPQYKFPLANNFFYSPIKRRLAMLTKQNKMRVNYISRLLVLPLAVIVFAAFTIKAKTYSVLRDTKPMVVVIDAGHGGTDYGAKTADNIFEKDITLAIAKKIKSLNTNDRIKIILTRETDIYQGPQEKAAFAKEAGAELFISIHLDGIPESSKEMRTGLSVIVSNDQYQNSAASRLFASSVITNFEKNYGLPVMENPQQRKNGIWVLQESACPAIIIEAGCINNQKDLEYLKTNKAIETFAGNIIKAIDDYTVTKNMTKSSSEVANVNLSVDVKNADSVFLKSATFRTKALVIVNSKDIGNVGYAYLAKNIAHYNDVVIYNPAKAILLYGHKGRYGVIKVTMKTGAYIESEVKNKIDHDVYMNGFEVTTALPGNNPWTWDEKSFAAGNHPLFILNGKEVLDLKVTKIANDDITDLRLLSPETAMPVYGEKARNGVMIMNTKPETISDKALIILDGKVRDRKTFSQVMNELNFPGDSINSLDVRNLIKEEAIKKYGDQGKYGAIEITRKGLKKGLQEPYLTLSGISKNRIHISELKNINELKCNMPGFTIVSATVYFKGNGFPNVVQVNLSGGSLKDIDTYFKKIKPGCIVTFDNVMAEKQDGSKIKISGRSFGFYEKETDIIYESEQVFEQVETEPTFPGGSDGWHNYVMKNLDASMPVYEGWKPGIYKVTVKFIVDKQGNVSDVSTNDFSESKTAAQCINLIKNGPRWIPAKQNGQLVKAFKKEVISFVVTEDNKKPTAIK